MAGAVIYKNPFPIRCETYGCSGTATFAIGREGAPLQTAMMLCAECIDTIIASIPKEKLPVPPEAPQIKELNIPPTDNKTAGEETAAPEVVNNPYAKKVGRK